MKDACSHVLVQREGYGAFGHETHFKNIEALAVTFQAPQNGEVV